MNRLILICLLYILAYCQPSETRKEEQNILFVKTRYDTINVEDEYISFDFQLRDTTRIDFNYGFATLYFLNDTMEIRPYRHYVNSISPKTKFKGDITSDTITGKIIFKTKRGVDTTINYQKVYFISKNHFNYNGKGEVINGKKEGRWEFFDKKTGEIIRISYYKNGLKNGIDSVFEFAGQNKFLSWVYNFKNGKKEGKQLGIGHENAKSDKRYIQTLLFYKNGVEEDSVVHLDSNGKRVEFQ